MEQQKMKNCPFCGSKAGHIIKNNADFLLHKIICTAENCMVATLWHESREECAEVWNKRIDKDG